MGEDAAVIAWDAVPAQDRLMHPPDLPVPAADLVHACAHELVTCQEAAGHVKRHLETVLAAPAASPAFDFEHAGRHLDELTMHLSQLIGNLGKLSPPVGAEIGLLAKAMRAMSPGVAATPPAALPRTCAHLLVTARTAAGHIRRHLDAAAAPSAAAASVKFNTVHALAHTDSAREHLAKLADGLQRYLPPVGAEIGRLSQAIWEGTGQPPSPGPSRSVPADYDAAGPDHGPQPA